jgi:hypothetical protein
VVVSMLGAPIVAVGQRSNPRELGDTEPSVESSS